MTKAIPYIIGTVLIFGIGAVMLKQNGIIGTQDKTIKKQVNQITALEQKFDAEEEAKLSLKAENMELTDLVDNLQHQNDLLIKENASLKKKIKSQEKIIKGFQSKLNNAEAQFADLLAQIGRLKSKDQANQQEIAALMDQKKMIQQDMNELSIAKQQHEKQNLADEKQLMEQQIQARKNDLIKDIIQNTVVHFKSVSAHKDQYGKAITKIRHKKNNWYYTNFTFDLIHPDKNALLDELFIIKIVNKDNQDVLSYVEANPNFPESSIDTKGVLFKYDGTTMDMKYYNNELKVGENYEVQLYYVTEDGREHLLINGKQQIIEGKKLMKL